MKIPIYTIVFLTLFTGGCNEKPNQAEQRTVGQTEQIQSPENSEPIGLDNTVEKEVVTSRGYIDVPPENKAEVSPFFEGFIHSVRILTGEKVRSGQVLFTLKNPEYLQIQQEYLETLAQLNFLRKDYERQKVLHAENISSEKKFRQAEAEYMVMQARVNGLKEQILLMNLDPKQVESGRLSNTIPVLAPISGNVTEVLINLGEHIESSEIAVVIIDPEHIHLELEIFEQDVMKVSVGQTIEFRVPQSSNEVFTGEVVLISKSIHPEKRTVEIHGHIDENDEKQFIPGMFVEAEINIQKDLQP